MTEEKMRRTPTTFEGFGTYLNLHCRYVFWKQHPQSFQHIHWYLQRQPQEGMTTLQVILLWSLLHSWEIHQIKFSNLNKTVNPRGPMVYRLEWSYCRNNLSTYISLHIKLKWWEDVTKGFSCCFYTMHLGLLSNYGQNESWHASLPCMCLPPLLWVRVWPNCAGVVVTQGIPIYLTSLSPSQDWRHEGSHLAFWK